MYVQWRSTASYTTGAHLIAVHTLTSANTHIITYTSPPSPFIIKITRVTSPLTHSNTMFHPSFIFMFHPCFSNGSPMLHFHVSPMFHFDVSPMFQYHVSPIFHFHVSPMFQQWFPMLHFHVSPMFHFDVSPMFHSHITSHPRKKEMKFYSPKNTPSFLFTKQNI